MWEPAVAGVHSDAAAATVASDFALRLLTGLVGYGLEKPWQHSSGRRTDRPWAGARHAEELAWTLHVEDGLVLVEH